MGAFLAFLASLLPELLKNKKHYSLITLTSLTSLALIMFAWFFFVSPALAEIKEKQLTQNEQILHRLDKIDDRTERIQDFLMRR